MQGMIIGQYIIGDSIIHRLDPRTKLISCFIIILATAIPIQPIPVLLFYLAFILFIIHLSQIGVKRVLLGLRTLKILFLITFFCQVFLTSGHPILSWGVVAITIEGINLAISTFLRLVVIFLGCSLLTMTTSTLMISAGIELLLSPLTRLGFPVHQFAMIINISLRFIPTIIEETEIIRRAQKSRGTRFDSGPLFIRLKNTVAIIIPVLAASIQRANDLALAMESRCYTGDTFNHNRISKLFFKPEDKRAIIIVISTFVLLPFVYHYVKLLVIAWLALFFY